MDKKKLPKRIAAFWRWFQEHEEEYFCFEEKNQDWLLDCMSEAFKKVVEGGLAFEFSHDLEDGKREFIISADGDDTCILPVFLLCQHAPPLRRFILIPFRPALIPPEGGVIMAKCGDISLRASDVFFSYKKYPKKEDMIDLVLYIRGFVASDDMWREAVSLLLDRLVGEINVFRKISSLKCTRLEKGQEKQLHPAGELLTLLESLGD